jgi:hypothetical protein
MSVVDLTSGQSYASLSDAISGSAAGDVIQISAGSYVEDFPDITHDLTIEAVGGVAYLTNPQQDPPNGRAVINVPGNANVSLTLSGLDISGAVDDASDPPSGGGANGAGILFESGNGALLVEDCHIHNNEDGILAGAPTASSTDGMTVTIDQSEIDNNGLPGSSPRFGYDHNIYAGALTQLTVTNSYIHDALGGNEIKSRALATTIENDRIFDNNAPASYQIDLAEGGNDVVENNIIQKGPNSPQEHFADFGAEGTYAGSTLTFSGNTLVNDSSGLLFGNGAIGLYNAARDPVTGSIDTGTLENDAFYGLTNVNQDRFGPPNDSVSGAQILPLAAAPSLDTLSLFAATDAASLNNAIAAFNRFTTPGSYTIDLSGTLKETADLSAIANANPGVSLLLDGFGATLDGAGLYPGLAISAGTVTVQDLTIADVTTGGGLVVSGGATLSLASVGALDGGPIVLAGAGTLEIAAGISVSPTIDGFAAGDLLAFPGIAPGTARREHLNAGNTLTVSDSTHTQAVTLDPTQSFARTSWTVVPDGNGGVVVACYVIGTRIATPAGEAAIETLRIGDLVRTRNGEARAIKWIGRRFLADPPPAARPIRIRRGALGAALPKRDLLVSPEHALFLDGVLIPARHLVNAASILRDDAPGPLHYFHIELASHDLILAEGTPAETFLDCNSRAGFDNAASFAGLYPNDPPSSPGFCAPRVQAAIVRAGSSVTCGSS